MISRRRLLRAVAFLACAVSLETTALAQACLPGNAELAPGRKPEAAARKPVVPPVLKSADLRIPPTDTQSTAPDARPKTPLQPCPTPTAQLPK
jgi:hypothetical protein